MFKEVLKEKKSFIIFGIILILLIILSIILLCIPKIDIYINGDRIVYMKLGEEYNDAGATAKLKGPFSSKKLDVETSMNVNTSEIGKYIVNYKAIDGKRFSEAIRIVNVIDGTNPIITLNKDILMCEKNNLIEIDATATDNVDGDISNNIKYKVDDKNIYISVKDSSDNETKIVKEVKYNDAEMPQISIKGSSVVNISVNSNYNDEGATAKDSCDGDITEKIVTRGEVNTKEPGTYDINYSVEDSYGNIVTATRKVIVSVDAPKVSSGATIYLTFDDGPGQYTPDILNTLDEYGIKATFFVTNQFGSAKYQSYIKDEYEKGHTVAIHTYTHKWSIYDSVDTYLDDFNKIQNIIIEQTGSPAKYFRFPGGTSNRVAKVSMTELAKIMTEKGYVYFDWHIDSGDTHGAKKATKNYIINTVKSHLKGDGPYIILMHDIKKNTRDALPEIIEYAKSRGYTFKKIDDSTPLKQFVPHN